MKNLIKSIVLVLFAGLVLVSCKPENVGPKENGNDQPSLSGSMGDPHPKLDTVCQSSDTLFLVREDNGSFTVDKCFGFGGVPIPCTTTGMNWGYLLIEEGYMGETSVLDCDFTMAAGWYCDFNNWKFGLGSSFTMDVNGIPVVNNDWSNMVVNPVQNKWQLRIPIDGLPTPSFDIALRVGAVRLNLFGAVTPGSNTTLWGKNRCWNKANDPAASSSPWLMHFSPARCMEAAPLPVVETCAAFYVGAPGLGTCTNISANTDGLTGALTYSWSTGATTPTANVCPTSNTTYSVTISSNGTPVSINEVTVNVIDAGCGMSNGNNAQHKVRVCHLPPGNPTNQQNICIDWSAVPAHVARFRDPAVHPNQGHDSGCEIGICGSNPCLQ